MATFADQMVTKYETLLLQAAGLRAVQVDGQSVSYGDLERRHRYWKRIQAREGGVRPQAASPGLHASEVNGTVRPEATLAASASMRATARAASAAVTTAGFVPEAMHFRM